ncbi:hypothetical protein QTP88_005406 [Uroleucon formosanum]
MPSSSGGTNRAGQNQFSNKLKNQQVKNTAGPGYQVVGKNGKPIKNTTCPVSPSFQQIVDNPPTLDISSSAFNYSSLSTQTAITSGSTAIHMDVIVNDRSNEFDTGSSLNATSIQSTFPTNSDMSNTNKTNKHINLLQKSFSLDYIGPITILVESSDANINLGNWHPIKAAKFFSNNFSGITNIKPAGSKKIKISFNTIFNGNCSLNSNILNVNNYNAIIPSTLIFSYGIIKLDTTVSETEFFEGVRSSVKIDAFKRISIKKDDKIVQTRIVEFKFVAPKIPSIISVFNMIFDVKPSVRSPVQCNRCLRFGHTQKYSRSCPMCSHCGENNHSVDLCPRAQATDPVCLFCKQPHLATDRSCREWSTQKEIKHIMATENIFYKDALIFKKNNCYTTAFSFSDVVKSQPPISEILKPNISREEENFPRLNNPHHYLNSRKTKQKSRSPINKDKLNLPVEPHFSSPNGLCSLNDGSPTHVGRPNSTNSAIDLSFCSPDIIWYLSWQVLNDPHGSDHIPIIITANFNRITDPVPSCSAFDSSPPIYLPFNFNKANLSSYSLQIHNSISSLTKSSSPVFSYSTLTSIINNSADSAIPKKRLNTNLYPPSPPWWNSDCTEAVKNRTLLFRNFRRSGSMSDFINYRNACAQTTRLLKNDKRKKWKKFCSNLNPSFPIHRLWSTAKRYKNCINPVSPPDNDD